MLGCGTGNTRNIIVKGIRIIWRSNYIYQSGVCAHNPE